MCIAGVQRAMVLAHTDAGRPLELPEPLVATDRHWASLQARQLQRVVLESLLRWIEIRIDEDRSLSKDLPADADEAAFEVEDGADALTVGAYLDRASAHAGVEDWPGACGLGGETDIVDLNTGRRPEAPRSWCWQTGATSTGSRCSPAKAPACCFACQSP
nr:hypothetical protein [Methylorubrum extorquens]